MSVKKDGNRHYVEMETEVPGTPEQVWQTIATGPGISSWFVPTELEERVGGALTFHLGPGMDSPGVVTGWEPPVRFAYEERDWNPGAPPCATECIVETRDGGTCVMRMVHSLFTDSDEWDDQLESFEGGWPSFFEILRYYAAHFQGLPCSSFRPMAYLDGTEEEAFTTLTRGIGFEGLQVGERRKASGPGVPPLAVTAERIGGGKYPYEMLLRVDEPAAGIAQLGAYTWGGKVHTALSVYLYGDGAAEAAARDEPRWTALFKELFPAPAEAATAT